MLTFSEVFHSHSANEIRVLSLSFRLVQLRLHFSQRNFAPSPWFSCFRNSVLLSPRFATWILSKILKVRNKNNLQVRFKLEDEGEWLLLAFVQTFSESALQTCRGRSHVYTATNTNTRRIVLHTRWQNPTAVTNNLEALQLRVRYNKTCHFSNQVVTFHQQWCGPNGPSLNTLVTRSIQVLFTD